MSLENNYHSSAHAPTDIEIVKILDDALCNHKISGDHIVVEECPFCHPGTEKKDNQWKLNILRNSGLYKCFRCETKGNWKTLQSKLKNTSDQNSKKQAAEKIWNEAIDGNHPDAEVLRKYLKYRGMDAHHVPPNIRFHKYLAYYDGGETKYFPALIGRICSHDGNLIGIQRIYLDEHGQKAPVTDPKKSLGSVMGGSVRLEESNDVIGLAEGIETAFAVWEGTGLPMWATVSAMGLQNINLPDTIKAVHIWGDCDKSQTGQKAAHSLAERLYEAGIKVWVHIPPEHMRGIGEKSKDWLDIRKFSAESELLLSYLENDLPWTPPAVDSKMDQASWPQELGSAAYHGIIGEIVKLISPHTESDPTALLLQSLVVVGNILGRTAYYPISSTKHFLNLFLVMVGNTSSGRKGTSLDDVLNIFEPIFPDWYQNDRTSGLSSGEGLAYAVRDKVEKETSVKDKKTGEEKTEVVTVDPGVSDKRLLVTEGEYAAVLKQCLRETNILSTVIRLAWDSGNLITLTKNNPVKATGAHISIIGHITLSELRKYFRQTEMLNGFGNRFMFICVRRSQELPFGGNLQLENFADVRFRLQRAVAFARSQGAITLDHDARQIWSTEYSKLTKDKPGLFGAMVARAAPYVLRIATLYAVLDEKRSIGKPHLEAALAVWDYCERSCEYIFGDLIGDPNADRILNSLRESPNGLTRSEIRKLFQGHKSSKEIDESLAFLLSYDLAYSEKSSTMGRPIERWFAGSKKGCAESAKSSKSENLH